MKTIRVEVVYGDKTYNEDGEAVFEGVPYRRSEEIAFTGSVELGADMALQAAASALNRLQKDIGDG